MVARTWCCRPVALAAAAVSDAQTGSIATFLSFSKEYSPRKVRRKPPKEVLIGSAKWISSIGNLARKTFLSLLKGSNLQDSYTFPSGFSSPAEI